MSQPNTFARENFLKYGTLGALIIYFLLTVIITFPVIFHINSYIIGNKYGDSWHALWIYSWMNTAIHEGLDFFQITALRYPIGGAFYPLNLFNPLVDSLLQTIFNAVTSYNVIVILQITLSAFGMYLLVKNLINSKIAAFISGIIYGYSPFFIVSIYNGVDELFSAGMIPLTVLFLFKSFKEEGYKNTIMAAIFLVLTTCFSLYYGLMVGMVATIFFIFRILSQRGKYIIKVVKKFILFFLLASLLVSPLIWKFQNFLKAPNKVVFTSESTPEDTLEEIDKFSYPDVLQYFRISPFGIKQFDLTYSRDVILVTYLGYIVIFLSLIGGLLRERKKQTKPWVFLAVLFFIFSLGPYLYFNKQRLFLFGHFIPLPYLLFFKYVPFFWTIGNPHRFTIITIFSLSVLSGFAICEIIRQFKDKFHFLVGIFISGAILFEYIVFSPTLYPIPSNDARPYKYYTKLSKEKGGFGIIELPLFHRYFMRGKGFYMQAIHRKGVMQTMSFKPPFEDIRNNTFLKYISYLNRIQVEAPILKDREFFPSITDLRQSLDGLKRYDFKYIIVHDKLFYSKDVSEKTHQLLRGLLDKPVDVDDKDSIIVYRIK